MSRRFRSPYPGWDVMSQRETPSFRALDRAVLDRRRHATPPRRFLSQARFAVLEALCDTVIPQDERATPVPIANWLDAALAQGRGSGTRLVDMPPRERAWEVGLDGFEAEARARHGTGFAALPRPERHALLKAVDAGQADPARWRGMTPETFFRRLVLEEVAAFYYAHPAGQSEIGYGGPATARGYVRLDPDRFDPWEAPRGRWPERGGRR